MRMDCILIMARCQSARRRVGVRISGLIYQVVYKHRSFILNPAPFLWLAIQIKFVEQGFTVKLELPKDKTDTIITDVRSKQCITKSNIAYLLRVLIQWRVQILTQIIRCRREELRSCDFTTAQNSFHRRSYCIFDVLKPAVKILKGACDDFCMVLTWSTRRANAVQGNS